jgi:hypothetical protein
MKSVRNADNDDGALDPGGDGQLVIGYVDEVNGEGAEELPFVATRHELRQLANYWAKVILDTEYVWWFLYETTGTDISHRWAFAHRRINRIADLLGEEAVRHALKEAEAEFAEQCDPRHWKIFKHGTAAEREAVVMEINARPSVEKDGATNEAAPKTDDPHVVTLSKADLASADTKADLLEKAKRASLWREPGDGTKP